MVDGYVIMPQILLSCDVTFTGNIIIVSGIFIQPRGKDHLYMMLYRLDCMQGGHNTILVFGPLGDV